jgi:hypothetical protein
MTDHTTTNHPKPDSKIDKQVQWPFAAVTGILLHEPFHEAAGSLETKEV